MPVYVDNMYLYPLGQFGRMKMSHMVADTREELLAMADKIGVQRKWLQHADQGRHREHFDICVSMRRRAIAAGAIELTMHDLSIMCWKWREEDKGK